MRITADELYRFLPAIYRIRDAERGGALRALVEVLAAQAEVVEKDIDALYENWFIETCDEWAVPYLGDLLQARALYPVSEGTYSQRSRVANTIGYRRRKGTVSMLADLARDTTGWAAHVVEFFQLLSTTQHLVHIRPSNYRTPDLRQTMTLELEGTPFDTIAHAADVRHIDSGRGRHNVMNVGIFLWRLGVYQVRDAQAFAHGHGRFSVSPLGQPMPLFHAPEEKRSQRTTEADLPGPIRRGALGRFPERYYGPDRSLSIFKEGSSEPMNLVACDLSDWSHRPPPDTVAVDPELGRFAFAEDESAEHARVSYHYGFSAELGGGGYARPQGEAPRYVVSRSGGAGVFATLGAALDHWEREGKPNAAVEIADSGIYVETLAITVPAGGSLTLRAAAFCRPVLRLAAPLRVAGEPGERRGELTIEGLLVAGAPIEIEAGDLGRLSIHDSTLVPGIDLDHRGDPVVRGKPSLVGDVGEHANRNLDVHVTRSITGPLYLPDIASLSLVDSIVDSTPDPRNPGGEPAIRTTTLATDACTVFGAVTADIVELSNSIFTGLVDSVRKQEGCVRFCFLPTRSSVPRRHRCQPGLASETSALEVRPEFTSVRYGEPGYAQLRSDCPLQVSTGADDQSEMGAFHHLMQPQRETNLRSSLDEYLRVGLEAGIHYVT